MPNPSFLTLAVPPVVNADSLGSGPIFLTLGAGESPSERFCGHELTAIRATISQPPPPLR